MAPLHNLGKKPSLCASELLYGGMSQTHRSLFYTVVIISSCLCRVPARAPSQRGCTADGSLLLIPPLCWKVVSDLPGSQAASLCTDPIRCSFQAGRDSGRCWGRSTGNITIYDGYLFVWYTTGRLLNMILWPPSGTCSDQFDDMTLDSTCLGCRSFYLYYFELHMGEL